MQFQEFNKRTSVRMGEMLKTSRIIKIVQFVIIAVAVGLIIWDIYLYSNPGKEDTISWVIHSNAVEGKLFVLTWIWGIMASHLFIARRKKYRTVPEGIAILVLLLISVMVLLLGKYVPIKDDMDTLPIYMHIIFLVFGAICGYFLWPQWLEDHPTL